LTAAGGGCRGGGCCRRGSTRTRSRGGNGGGGAAATGRGFHLGRLLQLAEGQRQVVGLCEELAPLHDVGGQEGLLAPLGLHLALRLDDELDDVLLQAVVDLGRALLVPQAHEVDAEEQVLPLALRHSVLAQQLQHYPSFVRPNLLEDVPVPFPDCLRPRKIYVCVCIMKAMYDGCSPRR